MTRGVDDKNDRRVQQCCDVRGGARADRVRVGDVVSGDPAVEEPHDAFDHRYVGVETSGREQRPDQVGSDQVGVEVATDTSRGDRVIAGIDVVGADFERRNAVPGAA
ncbi:Uncharacterised protein [Mycobacteroides abscessus subsp. abscessus]|nr:Uncharacterised protein [Mycobacteroides abscessus subsp. abscessus]